MNTTSQDLTKRWNELLTENPKLRIRNAAQQLGVSEAELLLTKLGQGVTLLQPDFANILTDVEVLGKVMALTRNDECVHERKGVYLDGDFSSPHAQLFAGEDIDLRIFLSHWKHALAVTDGDKKSLQFFGKDGLALHKIYLTSASNAAAYEALVEKYTAEDQHQPIQFEGVAPKKAETPDSEIDVQAFRAAWENLKDTHEFFAMTRKFGVSRTQALRLADPKFVTRLENEKVTELLEKSAASGLPIMAFVGNRGLIQIHTGPVKRIFPQGPWINVMDPDFNLHLDTSKIHEVYLVIKPTTEGLVHAIEVFNKEGDFIVQFFGKRKMSDAELPEWQQLANSLANTTLANV